MNLSRAYFEPYFSIIVSFLEPNQELLHDYEKHIIVSKTTIKDEGTVKMIFSSLKVTNTQNCCNKYDPIVTFSNSSRSFCSRVVSVRKVFYMIPDDQIM